MNKILHRMRPIGVFLLLTLGLLLFDCSAAHAADDVVNQVQNKYSGIHSLKADFSQETYIELLDRTEIRQGKLYLRRNQFRVDYETPEKQSFVFDGQRISIYSPKFKEVEIYENADQRISREALTFLTGLGTLKKTFDIPKTTSKKGQITLTLIPKETTSHLKKIELILDGKEYQLRDATLWPKRGNRSHYDFSHVKVDQKLDDALFEFKVPKNVSVVKPEF